MQAPVRWASALPLLAASLIPLCALPAQGAEGIQWHVNVEDARAAATKSGKPVFHFIYFARQTACLRMRYETFKNPQVITLMQRFECCAVDAAVKANSAFVDKYALGIVKAPGMQNPKEQMKLGTMPAKLFQDAAGNDQYWHPGYVESPAFAVMLRNVLKLIEQKALLAATPSDAVAHVVLARAMLDLGLDSAVARDGIKQHFEDARAADADNKLGMREEASMWLAFLVGENDPPASVALLAQFLKDYPQTRHLPTATFFQASALCLVGETLRDAQDEKGADAKLRQAMELLRPFKVKQGDTTSSWATSEFSLQALALEKQLRYQLGLEPGQ